MAERLNVLMSAYACEPGKGSEPWVGWNWSLRMAQLHNVTVVTRANNRESIEEALESYRDAKPTFLYYDLPRLFIALKKRRLLPTMIYYVLWQLGVALTLRNCARDYDLVHHVTFNSFALAGFWWMTSARTVLGPLGGGMMVKKEYLPLFRRGRWKEMARTLFVRSALHFPPTRLAIKKASYILCANRNTLAHLSSLAGNRSALLLETALDTEDDDSSSNSPKKENDIIALWVGSLKPRKALELGLRALASVPEVRLEIVGSGTEGDYLRQRARELGIADRVVWKGHVPHSEIESMMAHADLFLFTSVRDTSGNVVLEAMAAGVPIVAIDHQGVGDILDNDCAILIEPGTIDQTVSGFASAIRDLANDNELRRRLGQNGKRRLAEHFSWANNRDAMDEIYRMVVNARRRAKEPLARQDRTLRGSSPSSTLESSTSPA